MGFGAMTLGLCPAVTSQADLLNYFSKTNSSLRFLLGQRCLPDGRLPPVGRVTATQNTHSLGRRAVITSTCSFNEERTLCYLHYATTARIVELMESSVRKSAFLSE